MKNFFLILLIHSLFFTGLALSESLLRNKKQNSFSRYNNIRDTIYTFSNYIIEVYLPEQKIYVHYRDGKLMEFLCSTGNPRLEKGVETPEGIFVIQNKARKVYSTQFDSTLMLNWMGFNWNIGFHALLGKSYYKYLGKRVSSHGCIRLSHETSEFLYKIISVGTPVFIHSGKSARVVAFADSSENFTIPDKKNLTKYLNENLFYLQNGLYQNKRHKLIINEKNLDHNGIKLGKVEQIPPQLPSISSRRYDVIRNLFIVEEK